VRALISSFFACFLVCFCLAAGQTPCEAAQEGPKSVAVQMRLAEDMAANEDWDEAVRRWISILYYFGPSDQEARADFEIGAIALRRGRSDLAVAQWEKVIERYPESEWADQAKKALGLLGKEPPEPAEGPISTYIDENTPADEQQFLIASGDMSQGLYVFAVRDYLKIPNLYPDSSRASEARFRIGTCQALLGRPDLAIEQWQRLVADYPDSSHAPMARGGVAAWQTILKTIGVDDPDAESSVDEEWVPFRSYDSSLALGLSYAEDLYENDDFVYALQEYAKVLCDIYTPKNGANPYQAYARYRMGVCAYRLGHRDAAARQWRRLLADFPESTWAEHANRALTVVSLTDAFSSDASRLAPALPENFPNGLLKRFHLAGQLVDCEQPLVAMKEYLKVIHVLTGSKPNAYQAESSYRLGECQHLLGRPDLAMTAWRKTIADYPDTTWATQAQTAIDRTSQREAVLTQSHQSSEQ